MTIEIKHKITGKVLLKVEAESLVKVDLSWANLREADLRGADLSGVDLSGAKGEFTFNFGVKLKVAEENKKEKME